MWKLNILTPKSTSLVQNTSTKRRAVTIHLPEERKEGRKEDTKNSGKLAFRPDHPRRRIKMKLCMVGGLRCVVIHVKCDRNRSRSYSAVGVENDCHVHFHPIEVAQFLFARWRVWARWTRGVRATWLAPFASWSCRWSDL